MFVNFERSFYPEKEIYNLTNKNLLFEIPRFQATSSKKTTNKRNDDGECNARDCSSEIKSHLNAEQV